MNQNRRCAVQGCRGEMILKYVCPSTGRKMIYQCVRSGHILERKHESSSLYCTGFDYMIPVRVRQSRIKHGDDLFADTGGKSIRTRTSGGESDA